MANFDRAFKYMLDNEDPPNDPHYGEVHIDNDGGRVRFGINENSFPYLTSTDFYDNMSVSDAYQTAYIHYQKHEWNDIKGDDINSQVIADKFLDMAVNEGSVEATKLVQRACGSSPDGVVGPLTIAAINGMSESVLLPSIINWWNWFIEQVIKNHPEYAKDKNGWVARANKVPNEDNLPKSV